MNIGRTVFSQLIEVPKQRITSMRSDYLFVNSRVQIAVQHKLDQRTGCSIKQQTKSASRRFSSPRQAWLSKTTVFSLTVNPGRRKLTNERKFTTYERDQESGLDYALNRFYGSSRVGFGL